jgi:hypothetical protein
MFKRRTFELTALTPISHGDTQTGTNNSTNMRLFMRAGLRVMGIPVRAPQLSENAIRSVLFRIPLHDHLLRTLDVQPGELPQSVVNLLFAGGNLAKSGNLDSNHLGHEVYSLYPSLSLLGGATDTFVLPRSKLRLACWPLTREFAPHLEGIATEEQLEEAEKVSVFDLLFEETRTRGTGSEASGNQTLYSYETLAAGARFLLETTLPAHASPEVEGALATALSNWDGYFGGQGRQGRGRMRVEGDFGDPAPYLSHLEANRERMLSGLRDGTLGTAHPLAVL